LALEKSVLSGAELDVETVEGDGEDPGEADAEREGALSLAEKDPGDVADGGVELLGELGAGVVGIEAGGGTSGVETLAARVRFLSNNFLQIFPIMSWSGERINWIKCLIRDSLESCKLTPHLLGDLRK
jgi:hypothetical protein